MVAFVQETLSLANHGSASYTVTLPGGVTAGSTLLLAVNTDPGDAVTSVSGCGATWSLIAKVNITGTSPSGFWLSLWKGVGATSGTTVTVNLAGSPGNFTDIHLSEWSGVGTITASTSSPGASTAPASTSLSLASGDYGYAALAWQNNPSKTQNDTPTSTAWTLLTGGYDATQTGYYLDPAYRAAAGSETAQHAWTLGASEVWASVTAKLSPAAAPPPYHSAPIVVRSRAVSRASVI